MNKISVLQKALVRNRDKQRKLYAESCVLQAQLKGICDHSESEPYQWEHDNGYGRQSYVNGRRCAFCGAVDRWDRGQFNQGDL